MKYLTTLLLFLYSLPSYAYIGGDWGSGEEAGPVSTYGGLIIFGAVILWAIISGRK